MNKLIKDSEEEYNRTINKEQIEETSRIRNLIVKIFGTQYLDCFDIQNIDGVVAAKIKDTDLILIRSERYEGCFFMRKLNILNGYSTNPITNFRTFYQNYSTLT